jgi:uncharacterized protein (TIGR00106 family)
MSVLLEFAMFPTSCGVSVSPFVSRVIKMIDECGHPYQLTPMGTIIETSTIREALDLVEKAYVCLEPDCERVYATLKFDIRKGGLGRMREKIKSIQTKIGNIQT